MNQIDYELGLASPNEDFSAADGLGAAKAILVGCNTKCNVAHPFSKSKRLACKAKCTAVYNTKVNIINAQVAAVEQAMAQQTGSGVGIVKDAVSAAIDPRDPRFVKTGKIITSPRPLPPVQTDVEVTDERVSEEDAPAGMSTGMKVGIGLAAIALIGGVVWYMRKKK